MNFQSIITILLKEFQTLEKSIKLKLISNGVHPIRLLQMANNVYNVNYFNLDTKTYEEIVERFPVFKEKMVYFDSYKQFIQSFKLDAKEIALYTALMIFSLGKLALINL